MKKIIIIAILLGFSQVSFSNPVTTAWQLSHGRWYNTQHNPPKTQPVTVVKK